MIGGGARSAAWRQLLADAAGAAVQVPAEEEAGCLGAAIQARVAFEHSQGRPLSFAEAAAVFVRNQPDATLFPRPGLRAAYDAARLAYRGYLRDVYAV